MWTLTEVMLLNRELSIVHVLVNFVNLRPSNLEC